MIHSIRSRITLWYAGFFSIALLTLGWFVYSHLERTVEQYEAYEEHNEIIEDLIEEALDDLYVALLISLPLMLVAITIGGWMVTSAALKPVDRLTRAAREITAKNLSSRLPVSANRDEIGRLAITLNEMISRLESAVEEAKRFSADASHELRTPLTIMQGEIEVTLQNPRSQEEYMKTLVYVLEEIRGLRRITENLLMLSRADRGELKIAVETVDLVPLIQTTVEEARILAEAKSQTISFETVSNPKIRGDQRWIKNLLLNLLDNAVSYTPEKSQIRIRVFHQDQTCGFDVIDDGMGIPPDEKERVFDRFYRRKTSSSTSGKAGLGLAICKWIVESHQGNIEILDSMNNGTTVRVTFPLKD